MDVSASTGDIIVKQQEMNIGVGSGGQEGPWFSHEFSNMVQI